eukprot:gene12552-3245_t
MSHFDTTEELDNIEYLQQQTRDPFQLELLDAVKRRQKKETGFADGEANTQRHSKELDIRMSKYLGNRQSPYRKHNQIEESPFDGEVSRTMSLGTSTVNNKRTTHLDNSKWSPSISVDNEEHEEDDLDNESDEDDDGVVIGNIRNSPIKQYTQGLSASQPPENTDASKESLGLKTRRASGKENELGLLKAHLTEEESLSQRRKSTKMQGGGSIEEREVSTNRDERRALEEGTNFESKSQHLRSTNSHVEPSPRTKNEIDDIFGRGATRKPDSSQESEGNTRMNYQKKTVAKIDDFSVEKVCSETETSGLRSRSGSKRGQETAHLSSEKQRSRSGSGRTTPSSELESTKKPVPRRMEQGFEKSRSGRASPLDALFSSPSRRTLKEDQEAATAYDIESSRSRTSSGKSSPTNETISNSEIIQNGGRERPKSAGKQNINATRNPKSRKSEFKEKKIENHMFDQQGPSEQTEKQSKDRIDTDIRRHKRTSSFDNGLSNEGRPRSKSEARNSSYGAHGDEFRLKRIGSLRSLPDKKQLLIDSDEEDDSIGIKMSGSAKRNHQSEQSSGGLTSTPGIRHSLVPDASKKTPLSEKRERESRVEGSREDRNALTNGVKMSSKQFSSSDKESFKLKIKGRSDGHGVKPSPMRATVTVEGTSSAPNKSRKAGNALSPRETKKSPGNRNMSKRSLSFTNISNINPKSPFRDTEDGEATRKVQYVDSSSLREQIYYDWLKQKSSKTKAEIAELKKREKEKEEEAGREKKDKEIMSQKAFEAWKSNKEETLKTKQSSLKEQKIKEKEKTDETQQKKLDAKKYFESWKKQKDEELIEKHRKKKEEVREKRKKEVEEKKAKKDEALKEKAKEMKEKEKEEKLKAIEIREKKRAAEKMFETWKEKKVESPREETKLIQRAWCPSSRNTGHTIPTDVKPVVQRNPPNRTRTLSASARLQNLTNGSTFKKL